MEREKLSKDIEKMEDDKTRMMTEAQIREIHELDIETRREDVRAKKSANIKQHLLIQQMLSERMAKDLVEVDSEYRIMMNDLLAVRQSNKVIEIGDEEGRGEGARKS